MLQSIRDKSRGWFAYVVIAFISIPFMFWGIQEYVGGGDKRIAVTVNDMEISVIDYQRSLQQYTQRLRELFGVQLPAELANPAVLQDGVINGLIRDYLKSEFSNTQGMRISDEHLLAEIRVIPMFQENRQFSPAKYEQVVTQQFRSKAGFEQQLRQDLLNAQLESAIADSTFMLPTDRTELQRFRTQQRIIRYVVIDHKRVAELASVNDEQIAEYYDRNQASFVTPERLKLSYIVLDERKLAERVQVDESALKSFYEEYRERYSDPESRRLGMILLKLPESIDTDAVEAVRIKADALYQRLTEGEEFEALARENSQDALSAAQGGDLGWVSRGEFANEIEEAAFAADAGTVTRPMLVDNAYRLFKILEVRGASPRAFETVKVEVEQEFRQRQVERIWIEQSDRLVTLAYENPSSLDAVAAALDLDVQATDWITAEHGSGIAADPKVRAVAFSAEVLGQRRNSEVVDLGGGREIVVRVAEHEPSRPRPLDDVKEDIRRVLERQHQLAATIAAGEEALASVRGNRALDSVAYELNAEVRDPGKIARDADLPQEILAEVFRMNKPVDQSSVFSGVSLSSGDYAILELKAVEETAQSDDRASSDVEDSEMIYAQRQTEALLNALQSRAKIKIFEEHLR
ncbi:MAG: SurA N-terminal domain-containing protein [Thiotrichales bacterium]